MAILRRRAASPLIKYDEQVAIKRRQKAEKLLGKVTDLEVPHLKLPKPRLVQGEYAYMLIPDGDNAYTDEQLEARKRSPYNSLIDWLNKNKGSVKVMKTWPANYERRK